MPTGKNDNAKYRPDLGQAVMEYVESAALAYIGLQIVPIFRTAVQASSYPVIPMEALLKLHTTDRAPRGGYQRGDSIRRATIRSKIEFTL